MDNKTKESTTSREIKVALPATLLIQSPNNYLELRFSQQTLPAGDLIQTHKLQLKIESSPIEFHIHYQKYPEDYLTLQDLADYQQILPYLCYINPKPGQWPQNQAQTHSQLYTSSTLPPLSSSDLVSPSSRQLKKQVLPKRKIVKSRRRQVPLYDEQLEFFRERPMFCEGLQQRVLRSRTRAKEYIQRQVEVGPQYQAQIKCSPGEGEDLEQKRTRLMNARVHTGTEQRSDGESRKKVDQQL